MRLLMVFAVIHLATVCAEEDPDEYYATQSPDEQPVLSTEPVYEPPVPVLQLKSDHADVFSSEKVELNCKVYSSSDWIFTWKKDGKELHNGPELSMSEDGSVLTITAETNHAGDYTCTGQHKNRNVFTDMSKPIKVTVMDPPTPTAKQLTHWPDVFETENVALSCEVSSSEWTFTWYKNNGPLHNDPVVTINEKGTLLTITSVSQAHVGQYSCKAHLTSRGITSQFSDTVDLKVSHPPTPTAKQLTHWPDVFETENVALSCEVSSSEWTFTWYKNNGPLHNDPVVTINEKGTLLTITSVSQAHVGQYSCKAHLTSRGITSQFSNTVDLKVSPSKPKPAVTRSSNFNTMYPEESIKLECVTRESTGWDYVWYHNGSEIPEPSNGTYTIAKVAHSDSGDYHCKAKRGSVPFYTEASDTISLRISDPPTPTAKQLTHWPDVFETENVALSCEVSSSEWTFTWYKNNGPLHNDPVVTINEKGTLLTITSVSQAHVGQYSCKAHLKSRGITSQFSNTVVLKVSPSKPKPAVTQSSDFNTMYPEESIKFECVTRESTGWDYVWYHNGSKIPAPSNGTYTIAKVAHSDRGDYHCKAKRGSVPFYTKASDTISVQVSDPPTPTVKQLTPWLDVFENENVLLSCEVSSAEWTFTWYKDKKLLHHDSVLTVNGNGALLNITSVSQSHPGQYSCKAHLTSRGIRSEFSNSVNIEVYKNVPVPILKKDPGFEPMYVGETVNFTCQVDVSSGWNYHWYKDGTELGVTSPAIRIHLDLSDTGMYSCTASRGATTTGHSKKMQQNVHAIPTPSLKRLTRWLDVFPHESVKMSCEMPGSSGWLYTWHKDEEEIKADNTVSFNANGHTFSIGNASSLHRGVYSCSGKLQGRTVNSTFSSNVTLHVYDKTPTVTLMQNPQDKLMHTEDLVSFSCHINVSSGWDYLWYKDDRLLATSGKEHNISSAVTADTGLYKCQVKRGDSSVFKSPESQAVKLNIIHRPQASITLQTGWSEAFSTDSLILKCNVTDSSHKWNFTWFKEETGEIDQSPSAEHTVTPKNDPEQGQYYCQGISNMRPFYSQRSALFKTRNLLLKRRILLSISGCLFFGIIAVFLGCIFFKIIRKPAETEEKLEENDLFVSMKPMNSTDAPCPLVEFITDASMKAAPTDVDENGAVCCETTPLPITSQEDQALMTNNHDSTENGGGLVSFQK